MTLGSLSFSNFDSLPSPFALFFFSDDDKKVNFKNFNRLEGYRGQAQDTTKDTAKGTTGPTGRAEEKADSKAPGPASGYLAPAQGAENFVKAIAFRTTGGDSE